MVTLGSSCMHGFTRYGLTELLPTYLRIHTAPRFPGQRVYR